MAKPRLILRDLRHPRLPEGSYELNRSPIRIGRGPRCEIRLHADRIADVQVILRQEADRWTLHPVGPAEGCEIHDGYLAESARLDHGTTFRIGHVEMMLSMGHTQAASPAAEAPREPAVAPEQPERPEEMAVVVAEEPAPAMPEPAPQAAAPAEPEIAAIAKIAEFIQPVEHVSVEIPPAQAPESTRPAFAGSALFPDAAPAAPISHVSKRPRNLKIGPLPSSAAAAVSKALGSFAGAETVAGLAAPRASAMPRTAGVASAILVDNASTAAFGHEIPRHSGRSASPEARKPAAADAGFEPPIVPAGSRTMPLRRFLRDHDSSNLFDGRSMPAATAAAASAAPLVFGLEAAAFVAPIAAGIVPIPPVEEEVRAELDSDASTPMSPWFSAGNVCIPAADAEPDAESAWPRIDPATVDRDTDISETEDAENPLSIESAVADFENWLQSVGPNLEPVDQGPTDAAVDEVSPQDPGDPEDIDSHAETGSAAPAGFLESEPEISAEATLATLATKIFDRQPTESRIDPSTRSGLDAMADSPPSRTDAHEWPSAQDILRWSADRHGRSFLLASSEDLKSLKMAPDRTRPREWFRMNFPTALVLCLAWLGGAGFLVSLGLRMSLQDELTQQSIAAVMAAEKSGAVPRLDTASMQRLTQPASWWEVPPVQRWFRAVFVKMREDKGQPLQVAADQMASEVASLDPLYPPARFWKNTSPSADVGEPDLSSLSLDLLPLIMQADFERRRGNHEQANAADRVALKMASDLDKPLKDQEIAYDAEFGTKRFLLPGQKRTLAILKRIAKEPDAANILNAVMPEDSPVVWLTAAQLMRHAGLGDAEALAARAAEFPIPQNLSTERRQALELVRAEANAMLGKNDIAIETYDRLVREIPDSEWKRTVYLNLGMLNLQSLKTEAAKLALKKARGEDPDHEIDRHAIATIRGLSDSRPEGVRSAATVRAN